AADSYADAPAMQVAQENRVIDMSDSQELQDLINDINPDIIIPEIEAISTQILKNVVKSKKIQVVPSSDITAIAMDREALR
ncbi:phosphoribosylglycinamide formyltransferase 2, partial [Bifidobacterium sp. UMB1230]|nr:phosphoribosylglycinamide formyltransferase 2 [Bifidobacterium sp. UMB1230]